MIQQFYIPDAPPETTDLRENLAAFTNTELQEELFNRRTPLCLWMITDEGLCKELAWRMSQSKERLYYLSGKIDYEHSRILEEKKRDG